MKKYIKLFRVKHYIKNLLIFVPMVFANKMMDLSILKKTICGFFAFSFMCSAIYIINDIKDVEKDRLHETKKMRPIASGEITIFKAGVLCGGLCFISIAINYFVDMSKKGYFYLLGYLVINIFYSICEMKNIALIDVILLVLGFVLRIQYGGALGYLFISPWLYLVVISGAFYMAFGKRRNELVKYHGETRTSLKLYSEAFLDKAMNSCLTLTIVFYSMWCIDKSGYIITIPMLMVFMFRYSMIVEGESDGDPVEVMVRDIPILIIGLMIAVSLLYLIYR